MSISVIIPVYNEEKYLEKTLENVKNQSFKDFEIIIICNGCTDSSFKIARKYTDKVYNLKEKNVSKAKNFGASKSENEFLAFLDADVILNENVLERVNGALNKNNFYGTAKGKGRGFRNKIYLGFKNYANNFKPWSNGFVFCNKKSFLEVKGFNEKLLRGELKDFFSKIKGDYKRLNAYVEPNERRIKNWGIRKSIKYWIFEKEKKEYEAIR